MAKTDLYRIFDADGVLLYVGISWSALVRLGGHSGTARWFDRVARVSVQKCQSLDEARAAERQAIQTEDPLFNVLQKPKPKKPTWEPRPEGAMMCKELAGRLTRSGYPVAASTLSNWSSRGEGPPVAGVWREHCMYQWEPCLAWARARCRQNVSSKIESPA
jgi:hypothetical protein